MEDQRKVKQMREMKTHKKVFEVLYTLVIAANAPKGITNKSKRKHTRLKMRRA